MVPYQVFGFPVLDKDLDDWADRLKIKPKRSPIIRQDNSWRILRRAVRAKFKCPTTAVRLESGFAAMFFIIGSNETPEDLARTQNMTLVKDIYDLIRTRHPPGWFSLLETDR